LLNERHPPAGRPPRSYVVERPAGQPDDPETSEEIAFPVSGVEAGEYVVRVRVDGAESLLEVDASGEYDSPEVEIT
jgi:hypothetical protein